MTSDKALDKAFDLTWLTETNKNVKGFYSAFFCLATLKFSSIFSQQQRYNKTEY